VAHRLGCVVPRVSQKTARQNKIRKEIQKMKYSNQMKMSTELFFDEQINIADIISKSLTEKFIRVVKEDKEIKSKAITITITLEEIE